SQRCDSVRPICGPCRRAARFEDCGYGDAGQIPNIQKLEESISHAESRIMELENPANKTRSPRPSVMLKNPYTSSSNSQSPELRFKEHTTSTNLSSRIIDVPLQIFAPHAQAVGFFLNKERFWGACSRMGGGSDELPPALISSVCLWAACLSASEPLASQETEFLSRALKLATTTLPSTHRLKIVYGIQIEVLLCQYFLHKGRLVEAQYHLSVAVSYVVMGKLSAIRSSRGSPPVIFPRDCIEEGELIVGFWTVYSMDKTWSSSLNFPSNFASQSPSDIDTPWPLEMEEYERVSVRGSQLFLRLIIIHLEPISTEYSINQYRPEIHR
ncbi:hypothetical protein B0H11DRAFT_1717609, partial [Mycena galericulata]